MITKMLMTFFYLKLKVNIKSSGIIKYIKKHCWFYLQAFKVGNAIFVGYKTYLKNIVLEG